MSLIRPRVPGDVVYKRISCQVCLSNLTGRQRSKVKKNITKDLEPEYGTDNRGVLKIGNEST